MASRPKKKMEAAERAKQFMPFAALKGLPEALAERERIVVQRVELSEDMTANLERKMRMVMVGQVVTIVYYRKDGYVKVTGMVERIDFDGKIVQVVDKRVGFKDILDIEMVSEEETS